jgi:predicted dehydrogenase
VPAINDLPSLKLAAVATRNEQSAREAAEAVVAERWFVNPFAMIRDDRLDLITISVKVPAHRELVLAALDAGKAVYCEAPLGRSVAEIEEMARLTSYRDRIAGTFESGRAACRPSGFLGRDWATAQCVGRFPA